MKIHPLWFVCILVRISLIFIIRYLYKNTKYSEITKNIFTIILLILGLGFIHNGYHGSNNEIQIAKVFWHETRYIHGVFFILACIFLKKDNIDMNSLIIFTDLLFSISYRIFYNK